MRVVRPGEGPSRCPRTTAAGTRCANNEVEGLEACLQHVDDELLEEAEEITGLRRCRTRFGQPDACRYLAVKGTDPPACKNHGANRGSNTAKSAATRLVEGKIADRLVVILAEHGEKLMHPDPVGNPLTELLDLAAEVKAFKEILRNVVAYLFSNERIRYAHDRIGEQLRAEVVLYERAIERLGKLYMDIGKLGIESRLAAIEDRQVQMVERALAAALNASGLDLAGQEKARSALRRELAKAS